MLSLKNGRPGFDQVTGQNAWEHMQSNPQTYTIFNQAMRDLSASISPAVAAAFDWSRFPGDRRYRRRNRLATIEHPRRASLLPRHSLRSTAVVAEAPDDSRIERVGGDFFKDVPVQADAYVMRWILHDWSDEESVALLTNVRKVARPNARLMLVESVIPETPEFDMGKWMDLNMMVMATRAGAYSRRISRPARSGRLCARADRPHAFAAQHRRGQAGSSTA